MPSQRPDALQPPLKPLAPAKRSVLTTAPRFLIVGVLNTIVGLSVIFACKAFAGFGDALANATGYAVGLAVSFVLNRSWTFDFTGRSARALLRFLLVFAVAYALNLLTVLALIRYAGMPSYLAHVLGIVPYTTFSFLANHFFVFREAPSRRDSSKSNR